MKIVVLPLEENGKKPLIDKWQILQKSPLTSFKNGCNYGLLCGKINDFIVVDVDIKDGKKEIAEKFMETYKLHDVCKYVVKTTSGGFHFYFKYDDRISGSCKPKFDGVSCIDIQSNKTMVTLPTEQPTDDPAYICVYEQAQDKPQPSESHLSLLAK
jgi:hypothetical protein